MSELTTYDAYGREWRVRRVLWPFPLGLSDLPRGTIGNDIFGILAYALFVVLLVLALVWPFWALGRLIGLPWTLVVTCQGREAGREKVAGWGSSRVRMEQIIAQVSQPRMSPASR